MTGLTGIGRAELLQIIKEKITEIEALHVALTSSEHRASTALLNLTSTQARCTELLTELRAIRSTYG